MKSSTTINNAGLVRVGIIPDRNVLSKVQANHRQLLEMILQLFALGGLIALAGGHGK